MGINERKHSGFYVGLALVVILVLWFIASLFVERLVPSPFAVFANIFSEDGLALLAHAGVSLYRMAIGIAIALVLGVVLGLPMGYYQRWESFFSPFVYLLYPIPKIAFLPLIMLIAGLGDGGKIAIVVLIVVFQVIVSCRDGARAIPKESYYSLQTLGASDYQIFRRVIFPATLPAIFTSVRVSLGAALSVLFFAETYGTKYGLGYYIMDAYGLRMNYVDMYSGIVVLAGLGFLLFYLTDVLARVCCRWKKI